MQCRCSSDAECETLTTPDSRARRFYSEATFTGPLVCVVPFVERIAMPEVGRDNVMGVLVMKRIEEAISR